MSGIKKYIIATFIAIVSLVIFLIVKNRNELEQSDSKVIENNSGDTIFLYFDPPNQTKVRKKMYYQNGKQEGDEIEYFLNGQVKRKAYYLNDMLYGRDICYYNNQSLKYDYFWRNDNLFGLQKEYFMNGELKEMFFVTFENSKSFSLLFDSNRVFLKKNGTPLYFIYNNNQFEVNDTFRLVLYTTFDKLIDYNLKINKNGQYVVDFDKNESIVIHGQKGHVYQEIFKDTGRYDFNVLIESHLKNNLIDTTFNDSFNVVINVSSTN